MCSEDGDSPPALSHQEDPPCLANNHNGGRLFIRGRPFWMSLDGYSETRLPDNPASARLTDAFLSRVKYHRILKRPKLDVYESLNVLEARDETYFGQSNLDTNNVGNMMLFHRKDYNLPKIREFGDEMLLLTPNKCVVYSAHKQWSERWWPSAVENRDDEVREMASGSPPKENTNSIIPAAVSKISAADPEKEKKEGEDDDESDEEKNNTMNDAPDLPAAESPSDEKLQSVNPTITTGTEVTKTEETKDDDKGKGKGADKGDKGDKGKDEAAPAKPDPAKPAAAAPAAAAAKPGAAAVANSPAGTPPAVSPTAVPSPNNKKDKDKEEEDDKEDGAANGVAGAAVPEPKGKVIKCNFDSVKKKSKKRRSDRDVDSKKKKDKGKKKKKSGRGKNSKKRKHKKKKETKSDDSDKKKHKKKADKDKSQDDDDDEDDKKEKKKNKKKKSNRASANH